MEPRDSDRFRWGKAWELVQRGYLPVQNGRGKNNIDGIYGADTRAAVLAFQRANGLLADGICGSATRYALRAA